MTTQRRFERYLEPEITGARIARQWDRTRSRLATRRSRARRTRRAILAALVVCAVVLVAFALTSSGVTRAPHLIGGAVPFEMGK